MTDINIEVVANIEGLDELEKAFTEAAPRAVKKFLQRVHRRAASILVESAEQNAPYDSGELADDIHASTTTNKDGMLTRVGPSSKTFWGLFQEFGAPEANVQGQHWLEQAATEVQNEVLDEYMAAMDEGVRSLKGGK